MSSIWIDQNAQTLKYQLDPNDPVSVEFFRVMSVGMMRQSRKDWNVSDQESNMLYDLLQEMISRITDHKEGKRSLGLSKKYRCMILMETRLNFRQLVNNGLLPAPTFPRKERTYSDDDDETAEVKDNKEETKSEAEASADVPAAAKAGWPSELFDTWQFYNPFGRNCYPSEEICLRVVIPIESNQFMMPIKVVAGTDAFSSGRDSMIMCATLTTQHHEAVAGERTLSMFSPDNRADPGYKLSLVPHKLGFFQPSREQKAFYQDMNNSHKWKTPFKDMCANDPLVRVWPKEDEKWIVGTYQLTDYGSFSGLRLEHKEPFLLRATKGMIGVAAYAWQTRHGK